MDTILQKMHFPIEVRHQLVAAQNILKGLRDLAILETKGQNDILFETKTLWHDLVTSLPKVPQSIYLSPPLDQPISVEKWISGLVTLFHGSLFGKPLEVWLSQPNLNDAVIWGHLSPWSINLQNVKGDTYWYEFISNIESWRVLVEATLHQHHWSLKSNKVQLMLCWNGRFKSVDTFSIQGVRDNFWIIILEDNILNDHNILDIESFLISAQLFAQRGNSRIDAILRGKQLWMTLEMPNANLIEAPRPDLLPDNSLESVIDYIIHRAWPRYERFSKELEFIIATKIDQLQDSPIENKNEAHSPFKILQNILETLISAREKYAVLVL